MIEPLPCPCGASTLTFKLNLSEPFIICACGKKGPSRATEKEAIVAWNLLVLNEKSKPSNPKDRVGSLKLPLHLWPASATAMGSIGLLNGMLKYGRANWRSAGIRASIYKDAASRHLDAWFEGEENDPDDGVPHLAAALACLAIIVDAKAAGKLTDDRQFPGGYRGLMDELTPHVQRLKELHKDKDPTHYDILSVDHPL